MDKNVSRFNVRNIWRQNWTTKKKMIAAAVLACVAIVAFALSIGSFGGQESFTVAAQKYTEKIVATGLLQLAKETKLVSEVSGIVKTIEIKDGDTVPAGAVILAIDSSDLEYELRQKEASYLDEKAQYDNIVDYEYKAAAADQKRMETAMKKAEADWKAAEILYKEGAISSSERLEVQSAYDASVAEWKKASLKADSLREGGSQRSSAQSQVMNAQSAYESKLEELKKYTITAPWDAILLKTYVKEQQYINPGEVLAEIGEAGSSYVAAELDEKYFPYLFKGMKVEIDLGDSLLPTAVGAISVISPKINENTGTFSIQVDLPEDFPFQASDLTVNLEILISEDAEALLIPLEYLVEGEDSVYLYQNGKAVKTKIDYRLGLSGKVVVAEGLKEGDILIKPDNSLKDGKAVRIKK